MSIVTTQSAAEMKARNKQLIDEALKSTRKRPPSAAPNT